MKIKLIIKFALFKKLEMIESHLLNNLAYFVENQNLLYVLKKKLLSLVLMQVILLQRKSIRSFITFQYLPFMNIEYSLPEKCRLAFNKRLMVEYIPIAQ